MDIHPLTSHEIARLRCEERLLRAQAARRATSAPGGRDRAVVHAHLHARVDDDELEAELFEVGLALEIGPATAALPLAPGHLAGVDDERTLVPHSSQPSWYADRFSGPKRAYASSGFDVSSSTLASYFAATSFTA
jgi:hypothetical protein